MSPITKYYTQIILLARIFHESEDQINFHLWKADLAFILKQIPCLLF